jgi:hypothetical protein
MQHDVEEVKNPNFRVSEKWLFLYYTLCKLGKSKEEDYYIFDKYTNFYTLCASVGNALNKRAELESPDRIFTLNEIDKKTEWPVLRAIAWRDSNQFEILTEARQTIKICDEYAEAGIQYLYDEFFFQHVENGHLLRPKSIDIETHLSYIVKGVREQVSLI